MALTDEQVERYARHLILKGVGVKGQKRLLASSVLIIGAGGLGSPAALYLAAAGVGHIGLVDGDVVDMSNLQRQIIHTTARVGAPKVESAATAIRALNPDVTVDTYYELVDASNIAGLIEPYDLVIDATDNFAAKFLINDACVLAGKPYIHAGVVGFAGQVMTVIPGEGPCYRCIFRDLPAAGEIPTCKEAGVLGAVVGVIGSLEATEAVKLIAGVGEPLVDCQSMCRIARCAVSSRPLLLLIRPTIFSRPARFRAMWCPSLRGAKIRTRGEEHAYCFA